MSINLNPNSNIGSGSLDQHSNIKHESREHSGIKIEPTAEKSMPDKELQKAVNKMFEDMAKDMGSSAQVTQVPANFNFIV
jgi:hypothetical protein